MALRKTPFKTKIEGITEKVTVWIGTPLSIALHSLIFIGFTVILALGFDFNKVILVWNTTVSLEAIYLALFIQMTVNRNTQSLEDVTENIDEIQEDVEDLEQDVDKIQEDVEGVEEDIDKIQEDVEEDTEDIHEKTFATVEKQFGKLAEDMQILKKEIQLLKTQGK